jgi:hypothetical protein
VVLRILVAVLIGLGIGWIGLKALRAVGGPSPRERVRPEASEDVTDLAVFFVCRECGTELQVTRLGEVQVPRHCGEPMQVVQRPYKGSNPSLN